MTHTQVFQIGTAFYKFLGKRREKGFSNQIPYREISLRCQTNRFRRQY